MQALVLTRTDFREVDQMISLYTVERGRQDVLARGMKKGTSKLSALCEPFMLVDVDIVAGKQLDHLIKVHPVSAHHQIRADMPRALSLQFLSHFLSRVTREGQPDTDLFFLLRGFVQFLDSHAFAWRFLDAFFIKYFVVAGVGPLLDRCVVCSLPKKEILRQQLADGAYTPGFYFAGGGMVCHSCAQQKRAIEEEVFTTGIAQLSSMDVFVHGTWEVVAAHEIAAGEQKKLHELVYAFVLYHSERRIADWGGLRRIAEAAAGV